jgi:LacI family transcriptional regulator
VIGEARPTMNDVARTAGVSLKTVSRVVNGETTVAPDLVARVRAAVESLHYRPHIGASMLRRNDRRTMTIGVLLEDVGNPFSSALHRAIEDESRLRGVQVLTGSLDEDPHRERELAAAFASRSADGLIIAPTGADQSHLRSLPDIPVVFVDRPGTGFASDSVLATNVSGSQDAVRHLVAHGHRRIAYVGDHLRVPTAGERHRGYLAALTAAGLTSFAVRNLRHPSYAESAVLALFDRGPAGSPTALFTSQNLITIGAFRALRRLRLQERVALIGFDDFPLADLLEPAVTVVAQDPTTMGRTAARALFDRINGADDPPREFWIPTRLIPRGSGEIPPPS